MKEVIVIGSGGHAKVVIDILSLIPNIQILGVTSNVLKSGDYFLNYPVLGDDDSIKYLSKEINLVMGLGGFRDNNLRLKVFNLLKGYGFQFTNAIHPSAYISKTAKLGEGVVIFPGVIINTEAEIGDNTIIATGATIDHETKVGNHVLVSAGVTIGAYCEIEENVLLALGSKVVSGIKVKKNSLIAAGAVVVKDINENEQVYGIPAKPKINLK